MINPIKNLFAQTKSILQESLAGDVANYLNTEESEVKELISLLSFSEYLELGNAVDIDDTDAISRILKLPDGNNLKKTEFPPTLDEDEYEHQDTLQCNLCGSQGYDRHGNTCTKCGGQGRLTLDGEYITGDEFDLDEEYNERRFYVSNFPNVRGRYRITAISKDKDDVYDISMGKNGVSYDPKNTNNRLRFTDNQAKPMTADWIYNAMNAKSLDEADRPTATELGQPAKPGIAPVGSTAGIPGAKVAAKTDLNVGGPDIEQADKAKQPTTADQPEIASPTQPPEIDDQDIERKEVDDLQPGDEIEIADIGGQPVMAKVMSTNGPGNTIVVRGEKQTDHMIKKDSILVTPMVQEARLARLKRTKLGQKNKRTERVEQKKQKDIYEIDTDAMREAYEKALEGMPNLDRYWVYINRPDVDYVMYHIPRSQAKEGEPRFLKVDKATGDWQTQVWKRNNEPAIQQGKGSGSHTVDELNEDTQASPIKALRAILQGAGIGTGRGYNDKNIGNRKLRIYTSDLKNQNVKELERIVQKGMKDAGYQVRKVIVNTGMHHSNPKYFPGASHESKMFPNVAVWLEGNPVSGRYQTELDEVAPPGMEGWIKKRKPEFKKRYGDRWEEVLYATAWKQKNNESIEEDFGTSHQKKIAIDTVRNPSKGLLSGPSAEESEKILRDKFGYSDKQIANLKENLNEDWGSSDWTAAIDSFVRDLENYDDMGTAAYDTAIFYNDDRRFANDPWSHFTPLDLISMTVRRSQMPEKYRAEAESILNGEYRGRLSKELEGEYGHPDAFGEGINEALHFFVEPIIGGMFEVRNSEGDLHDTYDDGKEARRVAADLNAQHNKVDEGFKNTIYDKVGDRVMTPMGAGTVVEIEPENINQRIMVKLDVGDFDGDTFKFDVFSLSRLKEDRIDHNEIIDMIKPNLDADMDAHEILPLIGYAFDDLEMEFDIEMANKVLMDLGREPIAENVYEDIARIKELAGIKLNKVNVAEMRRGNETNSQEMRRLKRELKRSGDQNEQQYLRLEIRKLQGEIDLRKERAGLTEAYHDFYRAPRRALKSGVFKSKAIGNTVKIMGPTDFGNDEHHGEIGVITNARREPTFSQMHPFVIMYSVKLENGEKVYIRRENIRKVKSVQETDQKTIKTKRGPCDHCRGTGKDNAIGDPCIMCAGSGMRNYEDIKETASGGATSAGAIASSPTALSGMQSRNASIYGQTKLRKKPTPKKRATREEAGDGIGRNKKE